MSFYKEWRGGVTAHFPSIKTNEVLGSYRLSTWPSSLRWYHSIGIVDKTTLLSKTGGASHSIQRAFSATVAGLCDSFDSFRYLDTRKSPFSTFRCVCVVYVFARLQKSLIYALPQLLFRSSFWNNDMLTAVLQFIGLLN